MHVAMATVGRMKAGPERELVGRYLDRAIGTGKALGLTGFSVSETAESRAGSADRRKREEAEALAGLLPANSIVIALDERGRGLGSEALATLIGAWRDEGRAAAAFLIGGADGLDAQLRDRADLVLSFSPLTWPHQMVRIMLAEQLYRSTTILAGHPYHRGG